MPLPLPLHVGDCRLRMDVLMNSDAAWSCLQSMHNYCSSIALLHGLFCSDAFDCHGGPRLIIVLATLHNARYIIKVYDKASAVGFGCNRFAAPNAFGTN